MRGFRGAILDNKEHVYCVADTYTHGRGNEVSFYTFSGRKRDVQVS